MDREYNVYGDYNLERKFSLGFVNNLEDLEDKMSKMRPGGGGGDRIVAKPRAVLIFLCLSVVAMVGCSDNVAPFDPSPISESAANRSHGDGDISNDPYLAHQLAIGETRTSDFNVADDIGTLPEFRRYRFISTSGTSDTERASIL